MFTRHIGATGVYDITDGDEFAVSCVEFTLTGFSGSLIPQMKQMTDGPAPVTEVYLDCTYINANTGTSYAAGTAITSDGRFLVNSTGAKLGLNVGTAGPAFWVTGKPFIGTAFISSTGGGGGGGGAITVADGADVAQGSTTDAAAYGDTNGSINAHARALTSRVESVYDTSVVPAFKILDITPAPSTPLPVSITNDGATFPAIKAASTAPLVTDPALVVAISPNSASLNTVQGTTSSGASASAIKPVLVGSIDVSGNLQGLTTLAYGTSVSMTGQQLLPVMGHVYAYNGSTAARVLTASNTTDGGGTSSLAIGNTVYNGATWDRQRGNTSGTFVVPSAGASTEAGTLSITTGATAQSVFASNTARTFFSFANSSDTLMMVRLGAANATATVGFPVAAGGSLNFSGVHVPSDAITVYCATTGKTFYAVQG